MREEQEHRTEERNGQACCCCCLCSALLNPGRLFCAVKPSALVCCLSPSSSSLASLLFAEVDIYGGCLCPVAHVRFSCAACRSQAARSTKSLSTGSGRSRQQEFQLGGLAWRRRAAVQAIRDTGALLLIMFLAMAASMPPWPCQPTPCLPQPSCKNNLSSLFLVVVLFCLSSLFCFFPLYGNQQP